jgi:hypothetical protein
MTEPFVGEDAVQVKMYGYPVILLKLIEGGVSLLNMRRVKAHGHAKTGKTTFCLCHIY